MDPLLETVGFGPDTDLSRVRAALRRPGGAVFGGDRSPHARRTHLTGGVEILSTYDGIGLWPAFRRGARFDGRLVALSTEPWGPFPLRAVVEASDAGGPRRLEALAWSARRESWRTRSRATLAPSAFALDIAHCGPLGPHGGGGPRWLEPDPTAELPGTAWVAAPVSAVRELANPLTGHPFRAIELDVLGGLTVFVSPWQLADQACDHPEPGDWVSGSFVLAVERLRVAGIGV